MRLVTRQSNANEAAEKWRVQYPPNLSPTEFGNGKSSIDIQGELDALGPTPDPDKVDAAIGNGSWTDVGRCDECDRGRSQLVELGGHRHEESVPVLLCGDCLIKALNLNEENC